MSHVLLSTGIDSPSAPLACSFRVPQSAPAFVTIDRSLNPGGITLALDWDRYKQLCDSPDAFTRWMLLETSELLEEPMQGVLEHAMNHTPHEKPTDHSGGALTDMFTLNLSPEQARTIHARVAQATAAGETTSRTRARGLGGFVEAWREYLQFLDSEHVR